jgi:Ras-related protein Rab-1A
MAQYQYHQPPPAKYDYHLPPAEYDYLVKVLVIGNSGVGKSSLLLRYVDDDFIDRFNSTIGVDFKIKTFGTVDGKLAKVQIWDTAGQDRFKAIVASYYRGCHCVLLVFDLTNRETFDNIDNWVDEVQKHSPNNAPQYILIGTKSDLTALRQIPYDECVEKAKKLGTEYVETSARDNDNVTEAFTKVVEKYIKAVDNTPHICTWSNRLKTIYPPNTIVIEDNSGFHGKCC